MSSACGSLTEQRRRAAEYINHAQYSPIFGKAHIDSMLAKQRRTKRLKSSSQAEIIATKTLSQRNRYVNDEEVCKDVFADGSLICDEHGTIPYRTNNVNYYKRLPSGNCMLAALNFIVNPLFVFCVKDLGPKLPDGGYSFGQIAQLLQSTPFKLVTCHDLSNRSYSILNRKFGFFILRGYHAESKAHHAIIWDATRSLIHDRAGVTFQVTPKDCADAEAANAFFADLGYGQISKVAELRVYLKRSVLK